jgi:hypothetical protein
MTDATILKLGWYALWAIFWICLLTNLLNRGTKCNNCVYKLTEKM